MTSKRLSRLVRLKKLVERQRAADLAASQQTLAGAQRDADATQAELEELDEGSVDRDASAQDLVAAARWQGHLAQKLHNQKVVVEEREVEVDNSREEVGEAWRERRLMQGMHERAAANEAAEAEASERKEYEAIALNVYSRRGGEEDQG